MSRYAITALLAMVSLVTACRGETSTQPPIVPFRGMHEMPRYDVQERSPYFEDGRAMRPPVEGTIAREMEIDQAIAEGLDESDQYVMTIPQAVVDRAGNMTDLLNRGHERYDVYCAPCHGLTGDGHGMVSERAVALGAGAFQAANLTDDTFRHIPDGRLYATIANGVRQMPAYRAQIPVQDRWAIVAYVRALQLSQGGTRTAMGTTGTGARDEEPN